MSSRSVVVGVLLFACGPTAPHHHPDEIVDGGPDGPSPTVTLTVSAAGRPVVGTTVYFQNADSSLVAQTTTDATGTAGAVMTASGGYVTAVLPGRGEADQLATLSDVQLGDHLAIALAPQPDGPIEIQLVAPVDPGAGSYAVMSTCGSAGISAGVPSSVRLACGPGVADFIVTSYTSDGEPLHAFYQANVAVSPGATVTLSGSYAPLGRSTFIYTGIPAGAAFVANEQDLATPHGVMDTAFGSDLPANGAVTIAFDMPQTTATAITVTSLMPQAAATFHSVIDWAPYTPSYTLDLGSALLREYTTAPAYTFATRTIDWTEAAMGVAPDYVIAELHAYSVGPRGHNWYWTAAAAHATTSIALPALPPTPYDYDPGHADHVEVTRLLGIHAAGGYAAVRTHPPLFGVRDLVTGPSGRVLVEDIYPPTL